MQKKGTPATTTKLTTRPVNEKTPVPSCPPPHTKTLTTPTPTPRVTPTPSPAPAPIKAAPEPVAPLKPAPRPPLTPPAPLAPAPKTLKTAPKTVPKPTPPPAPIAPKPKPATTAAATMPSPPSSLSNSHALPPPSLPLKPRESPWCITGRSSGKATLSVHDDALRVEYVAGQVGSVSGTTFHAKPADFPTTECEISYRVHFNDDWDWKEGGKMPGLYIGSAGAAGGNWMPDAGSARVCFKQGGVGIAYTYIPLQVCDGKDDRNALDKVQGPEFAAAVQHTEKGTHVWRDGVGTLKRGQWNDVRLHVKLNSPDKKDGFLELEINGSKRSLPIVWRSSSSVKIEGISFASFFGGSSKSAAAPKNAVAQFKDITYKIARQV